MAATRSNHADECPFQGVVLPKEPPPQDQKLESRVGRLEGAVETMAQEVQEIGRSVGMIGKEIGNLRSGFADKMDQITQRMSVATQPKWTLVVSFVTVGFALLGLASGLVGVVMSGQAARITEASVRIEVANERAFHEQYEKGKSDAFISQATLKAREIDEKLQREMSLVNATTEAKVKALDEKLQVEFGIIKTNLDKDAKSLTEQVLNLRDWRLTHTEEGAEFRGRALAKQEMIEKVLTTLSEQVNNYHAKRLNLYEGQEIRGQQELIKGTRTRAEDLDR